MFTKYFRLTECYKNEVIESQYFTSARILIELVPCTTFRLEVLLRHEGFSTNQRLCLTVGNLVLEKLK